MPFLIAATIAASAMSGTLICDGTAVGRDGASVLAQMVVRPDGSVAERNVSWNPPLIYRSQSRRADGEPGLLVAYVNATAVDRLGSPTMVGGSISGGAGPGGAPKLTLELDNARHWSVTLPHDPMSNGGGWNVAGTLASRMGARQLNVELLAAIDRAPRARIVLSGPRGKTLATATFDLSATRRSCLIKAAWAQMEAAQGAARNSPRCGPPGIADHLEAAQPELDC